VKRRASNDWWPTPPKPKPNACDVCEGKGVVEYIVGRPFEKRRKDERKCPHCQGLGEILDVPVNIHEETGLRVYDDFEETDEIGPEQTVCLFKQPCDCIQTPGLGCSKCGDQMAYLVRKRVATAGLDLSGVEPMPMPSMTLFDSAGDLVWKDEQGNERKITDGGGLTLPWEGSKPEVAIGVDPGMPKDTMVLTQSTPNAFKATGPRSIKLINIGEETCDRCGGKGHDGSDHDL
jgi:hypothetical protein